MIEKISVTNFKSHAQTEIELGRVTALVGPNGCGKTSLLQAIQLDKELAKQIVDKGSWDNTPLKKYLRRESQNGGVSVEGSSPQWKVAVSTVDDDLRYDFVLENRAWKHRTVDGGFNAGESEVMWAVDGNPIPFFSPVYFKAIAYNASLPSYTLKIPPRLELDGNGLASVISYLKTSQEEVYQRIESDLKKIVPIIKRVRVHPVSKVIKEKRTISAGGNTIAYDEDRQVVAQELIFDTTSGEGLPASMISEGTLVTLALLTLLHTSDANLFLLDDIEQALHPIAQRQLIKTLKEFAEKHDKQILLTSHSGYIIDDLDAKDVWVMTLDDEGVSRCKRLSDHHDAERLLEVLTTGELADAVGEDWVLEAPKAVGAAND